MAVELAQADTRIRSLSVPSTIFGGLFGKSPVTADLYVESSYDPGFVWSTPREIPILAPASVQVMIFLRYLHTTSGLHDEGTPPAFIGPVMDGEGLRYNLGGLEDRVLYQTDDGDHNYARSRREEAYTWFARTRFDSGVTKVAEADVPIFPSRNWNPPSPVAKLWFRN